MTTFVLVPGAWFGDWLWQPTVDALRARGHDARAIAPAGLGDRAGSADASIGLADHVDDVVAAIRDSGADDVVLVAHSYASAVVPGTLRVVGDRVDRTIYVDTGPLGPEQAVADFGGPDAKAQLESGPDRGRWLAAAAADFTTLPPPRIEGLSTDQLAAMNEHATPQPFGPTRIQVGETRIVRRRSWPATTRGTCCRSACPRWPRWRRCRDGTCQAVTGRCSPTRTSWPRRSRRSPANRPDAAGGALSNAPDGRRPRLQGWRCTRSMTPATSSARASSGRSTAGWMRARPRPVHWSTSPAMATSSSASTPIRCSTTAPGGPLEIVDGRLAELTWPDLAIAGPAPGSATS